MLKLLKIRVQTATHILLHILLIHSSLLLLLILWINVNVLCAVVGVVASRSIVVVCCVLFTPPTLCVEMREKVLLLVIRKLRLVRN